MLKHRHQRVLLCCWVAGILLSIISQARAENELYIPELGGMLEQYEKQQVSLMVFEQIDSRFQVRIMKAVEKVKKNKTSRELVFFKMEYIELRALHTRAIAVHTVKLIKAQDQFIRQTAQMNQSRAHLEKSSQICGLKKLMQMVVWIDTHKSDGHRADGRTTEVIIIRRLHHDALTYILTTILDPHPGADPAFQRQVKQIRSKLYNNLKDLRLEFVYLGNRLEQVDKEKNHET